MGNLIQIWLWYGMGSYISVPPIAMSGKLIPYQRPMAKSSTLLLSLSKSLTINDQNRDRIGKNFGRALGIKEQPQEIDQ